MALLYRNKFAHAAIALGQQVKLSLGVDTEAQVCSITGAIGVAVADRIGCISLTALKTNAQFLNTGRVTCLQVVGVYIEHPTRGHIREYVLLI